MKKKTRVTLIISLIVIIIGGILGVVGMSALGWDFYGLDTNVYTEKAYSVADGEKVNKISVDASWKIRVVKGDKITLKYYESEKSTTAVSVSGGVLSIKETRKWLPLTMFDLKQDKLEFVLTVPDDMALSADGSNLSLDIRDIKMGDINLTCNNADVILSNVTAENLTLDSSNARVDVNTCRVKDVNIKASNADIKIANSTATSLSANGSNNNFDLADSTLGKGNIDVDNCDMNFSAISFDGLEVRGSNMKLDAKSITTDTVALYASNANMKLQIVGDSADYTVISKVKNGSAPSSVVGLDPNKLINIDVSNCKVTLNFI